MAVADHTLSGNTSKASITQARLQELLSYDPGSGIFTWKIQRGSRAMPGTVAGYRAQHGYSVIQIDGRNYYAHRLAWLYMYGEFPSSGLIDHKNSVRTDNRITNLREASKSANSCNTNMKSDNTSGVKGVFWQKNRKKWLVQIQVNRELKYLGYFTSKEEAEAAARAAREEFHGEFANHGDGLMLAHQ